MFNSSVVCGASDTKTETEKEGIMCAVANEESTIRAISQQFFRLGETQRTPIPAHLKKSNEKRSTRVKQPNQWEPI